MHAGDGEGSEEAVGIVDQVRVEPPIIDSATIHGTVLLNCDFAVAVFYKVGEPLPRVIALFEQALVNAGVDQSRSGSENNTRYARAGDHQLPAFWLGQQSQRKKCCKAKNEKKGRCRSRRPVIQNDKPDKEAAESRADDIAEVKIADPFSRTTARADRGVREQREC